MLQLCRNKKKDDFWLMKNTEMLLTRSIESSSCSDYRSVKPIRIFTKVELQEATDNFRPDKLLYKHEFILQDVSDPSENSKHAYYYFYKGIYEGRIILVCKVEEHEDYSEVATRPGIISIIAALSHINHKNIVKLLGCCLETTCPIQVYEFCYNITLQDQIHRKRDNDSNHDISTMEKLLSWDNRLRIATEIADAVTYLHTAHRRPVVHRNIKSGNVFLDENFVANLFDLSVIVSIPFGKTHKEVNRAVGTCGYLAPEQFKHRVSEKTDVYSFGVLLLELVTGYRPYVGEELIRMLDYKSMKSNMVDDNVKIWEVNKGMSEMVIIKQQIQAFLVLAVECMHELEEKRPTMMDVTTVLREIKRMEGTGNPPSTPATR